MRLKNFKQNKEHISYFLVGSTTLLLVAVMLFQYKGRVCNDENTRKLINQGYLANQTLIKFTLAWSNVWVVEKIKPTIGPENEIRGEASTSLGQAQTALDDFRKILTDKKCLIWSQLELISLLIAFLMQSVALLISRYK